MFVLYCFSLISHAWFLFAGFFHTNAYFPLLVSFQAFPPSKSEGGSLDPNQRDHPLVPYTHTHTGCPKCIVCFICVGHFPLKSPIISGSCVERALRLEASYTSSLPCIVWETWCYICQEKFSLHHLMLSNICLYIKSLRLFQSFNSESRGVLAPNTWQSIRMSCAHVQSEHLWAPQT